MKKLIFLLLLISISFSKDIKITKEPIRIKTTKSELNIINLPFEVSMSNIRVLGKKSDFVGNSKNKSIYFTLYSYPMDLIIFGGEYPIYLEFRDNEDNENEKIFNFFYSNDSNKKNYKLSAIDLEIKNIFKEIDENNNLSLDHFYTQVINENIAFSNQSLTGQKKKTYENTNFRIEKIIITNNSKKFINLKYENSFSKLPNIIAYTFSNLIVAPNKSVIAFFAFDLSKEL